ncbi:MAG: hypothetical protein Q7U04_17070 [Bacteriovorax sp.]|nr:hypothetical protein [Bacteriovorax sp.]
MVKTTTTKKDTRKIIDEEFIILANKNNMKINEYISHLITQSKLHETHLNNIKIINEKLLDDNKEFYELRLFKLENEVIKLTSLMENLINAIAFKG